MAYLGEIAEFWVSLAGGGGCAHPHSCPCVKGLGGPCVMLFGGGTGVTVPVHLLGYLFLGVFLLCLYFSRLYCQGTLQCALRGV